MVCRFIREKDICFYMIKLDYELKNNELTIVYNELNLICINWTVFKKRIILKSIYMQDDILTSIYEILYNVLDKDVELEYGIYDELVKLSKDLQYEWLKEINNELDKM